MVHLDRDYQHMMVQRVDRMDQGNMVMTGGIEVNKPEEELVGGIVDGMVDDVVADIDVVGIVVVEGEVAYD